LQGLNDAEPQKPVDDLCENAQDSFSEMLEEAENKIGISEPPQAAATLKKR